MPIPKPGKDEEEKEFISRCMSDAVMNKEYPDQKVRAGVCYTQWREKDEAADDAILYSIKGVPIFEAGKWKGGKLDYPLERLTQIVASANELKDRIKPYIYLGHGDEKQMQKFVGQPNVGILQNIRLIGDRIVADLTDMPKKVYEIFKNKGFRRWSVEIAKDWKDSVTGKLHERILSGLALLGAEHPAVNPLPDTIDGYTALYYSDKLEFDYLEADIKEVGDDSKLDVNLDLNIVTDKGGDFDMDSEKEIARLRDDLDKAREKLQAAEQANVVLDEEKNKAVSDAEAKVDELSAEITERDNTDKTKRIEEFLDEQTEAGKLIPAWRDIFEGDLRNAEDLDAKLIEMKGKFAAMEAVAELDTVVGDDDKKLEDKSDNFHKDQFKERFEADRRNQSNRISKDAEVFVDEFATVFSTHKAGERAANLEKSRTALRKEIESYL